MTVFYPTNDQAIQPDRRPDTLAYNLEEEKKLIAEATEEIKRELLAKWQKRYAGAQIFPPKLAKLNSELRTFMLSFEQTLFYNKLAVDFKLKPEQREGLPQLVWSQVLGRKWDGLASELQNKAGLDNQVAEQIAQKVAGQILHRAQELTVNAPAAPVTPDVQKETLKKENQVRLSIAQALKKYPRLGEQQISANTLRLKNFPAPARPSINNWINDYRLAVGVQKHGAVERGNYLFQTENAKKLTAAERQKLAYILKSLDEDSTLEISEEKMEVIFPVITMQATPKAVTPPTGPAASANVPPVHGGGQMIAPQPMEDKIKKLHPHVQEQYSIVNDSQVNAVKDANKKNFSAKIRNPQASPAVGSAPVRKWIDRRPAARQVPNLPPVKPVSRGEQLVQSVKKEEVSLRGVANDMAPAATAKPATPQRGAAASSGGVANINKVGFSAPHKFPIERRKMTSRISPIGANRGNARAGGLKISGNLVDLRS